MTDLGPIYMTYNINRSCKSDLTALNFGKLHGLIIHTYIFVITTLQSGLLSQFLTKLMLCVSILYIIGETYCLKTTPNDRFFFFKFSWQFLFTLGVFARNLLRGNRRRNTFCIFYVWPGPQTLALRLVSQHTTYQATATLRINQHMFF